MRCSQKLQSIILLVQTLHLEPPLENFSVSGKALSILLSFFLFLIMSVRVMTVSDPGDSDLLNFAEEHAS